MTPLPNCPGCHAPAHVETVWLNGERRYRVCCEHDAGCRFWRRGAPRQHYARRGYVAELWVESIGRYLEARPVSKLKEGD